MPRTGGARTVRTRLLASGLGWINAYTGGAATWASERVSQCGLQPLPHTTPHTLRRTYISIALFANRFDALSDVRVHRASAPLVGESRVAERGSRLSATLRC